jgi:transcriptional regulator with XRE-family HTH domain
VPRKVKTLKAAFGDVLRELRWQTGLSQEAFAHACDMHRTYISQLERGLKSPTLDTLAAIAEVLEVRIHQLLKMVEDRL